MKLLIGILILFSGFASLKAQRYDFAHFSTPEGLPHAGVYDMISDEDGFLWIASESGGLLRFDGKKFEVFGEEQGLSDASIRVLHFDHEQNLWFGTEDSGLGYFKNDSIRLFADKEGITSTHIRAIVSDSLGTVYAAAFDGNLFQYAKEKWRKIEIPTEIKPGSFRCGFRDSQNKLWFGTDIGVMSLFEGNFSLYNETYGISDSDILCLFKDSSGRLWAGSQTSAYCLDSGNEQWEVISFFNGKRVRSIAEDFRKGIWFGYNSGAYRCEFQGDSLISASLFTENNGLSNNRIRKLYVDPSNSLWFGTFFGGLSRLNDLSLARFDARSGWPDNIITAMDESSDGTIWLGTYEGNIYAHRQGQSKKNFNIDSRPENAINSIFANGQSIWCSTVSNGIWKWNEQSGLKHYLDDIEISGLCGFYGDVPLAFIRNEIWNPETGFIVEFEQFANGWNSAIRWNQNLVLGGKDGVLILDSTLSPIDIPEELRYASIQVLSVDPNGNLWLGTENKGLIKYNQQTVQNFRSKQNLPDPRIKSICFTDDAEVWIGTPKGLVKWEMDPDYQIVLDQDFLEKYDGLRSSVAVEEALFYDSNSRLWIGTLGGLFRFEEGLRFTDFTAPNVQLSAIDLSYEPVNWDTLGYETDEFGVPVKAIFDHRQNHLTFKWNVIETDNSGVIEYEFRLIGLDSIWSLPFSEPQITFTALPPGNYELQIRSRSRDNYWLESPYSYSFSVKAPIYREPWFIMLCAILLILIIWLLVQLRLAMLKKENQRLEEKVQVRTSELEAEKRKSDELLLNILPEETAEELKREGQATSRKYKDVSVLFSDFKGFTQLTEEMSSSKLVESLDECFRAFDRHTNKHKVEKIKTIGDAYMCATGLPVSDDQHAIHLVEFGLVMIAEMEKINEVRMNKGESPWPIRIGIHSGSVVAGVVGEKKFAYDIWGDTVNTASRMESSGKPGRINISEATFELVKHKYRCKSRGKILAKNKGVLEMYFVKEELTSSNENIHT